MVRNFLNNWIERGPISNRLSEISIRLSCGAWGDLAIRFQLIREAYCLIKNEDYDPYPFYVLLTPIESHIWQDIRGFWCNVRMYPQYPVGKYFVDFGDPWKKVAIEADGKQWHDGEKDRKRDSDIEKLGWTIYHVKGCDTIKEGIIDIILNNHYGSHPNTSGPSLPPLRWRE